MKLSIIIPAYNEASTIADVINQGLTVDIPSIDKEIIVVDDGSTDATVEILKREQLRNGDRLKVYSLDRNLGKGAAIRKAIEHVTGDVVLIQDADLEYDPRNYETLVAPIRSNEAEVVYGSRFLDPRNYISWKSRFAQKVLTYLTNLLYRSHLTDEATAYKVFKTEVLKSVDLQCVGFEFCPEITAKLLKRGYRIVEVPITYRFRTRSQGKKLHYLRDGLIAVYTLLKYRFAD